MAQKTRVQLYDRLVRGGYTFGKDGYNQFEKILSDENLSRELYKNVTRDGIKLGTYENFINKYRPVKESPSGMLPSERRESQESSYDYYIENVKPQQEQAKYEAAVDKHIYGTSIPDSRKSDYGAIVREDNRRMSDTWNRAIEAQKEMPLTPDNLRPVRYHEYSDPSNEVSALMRLDPFGTYQTQEQKQKRLNDHVLAGHMAEKQYKETVANLGSQIADSRKRIADQMKRIPSSGVTNSMTGQPYFKTESDDERRNLYLADRILAEAEQRIKESRKEAAGDASTKEWEKKAGKLGRYAGDFHEWGAGVWRGIGDKLADMDTYTFGAFEAEELTSLRRAIEKSDALEKYNNDLEEYNNAKQQPGQFRRALQQPKKPEALTAGEQAMLDAAAARALAEMSYETGWGYTAGEMTVEMVPFVLQLIASPGTAISKSVASGALRHFARKQGVNVTKSLAKESLERGTKNLSVSQMRNAFAKELKDQGASLFKRRAFGLGSRAIQGGSDLLITGPLTAVTTGINTTIQDTNRRMIGEVKGRYDEEGKARYTGHLEGDDFGSALSKSILSTSFEFSSEQMSDWFSEAGVTAAISNTKWGRRLKGSKVGKKIAGALKRADESKAGKAVNAVRKYGHIGSLGVEYSEEVFNNVLNAAFVGDMDWSTGERGVFNLDQNLETLTSLIPMQIGFGIAGGAGAAVNKYKTHRAYRGAANQAKNELGGLWENIETSLRTAPEDKFMEVYREQVGREGLTARQRAAVAKYGFMKLLNDGMEEMADEVIRTNPYEAELNDRYEMGESMLSQSETITTLERDIMNAEKVFTEEELVGLMRHPHIELQRMYEENNPNFENAYKLSLMYAQHRGAEGAWNAETEQMIDEQRDALFEPYANRDMDSFVEVTLADGRTGYITGGEISVDANGNIVRGADSASGGMLFFSDRRTPGKPMQIAVDDINEVLSIRQTDEVMGEIANRIATEREAEFNRLSPDFVDNEEGDLLEPETPVMVNGRSAIVESADNDGVVVRYEDESGNVVGRDRVSPDKVQPLEEIKEESPIDPPASPVEEENVNPDANNETPAVAPETAGQGSTSAPRTIPMEKVGNEEREAYHLAPIEDSVSDLYDGVLQQDEIDGLVSSRISEAEREVKRLEGKKPKIGSSKAAYVAKVAAWQEKLDGARSKLAYYQELQGRIAEITESELAKYVDVEKQRLKNLEKELQKDEPRDIYEYIAQELSHIRITPESYRAETGYGLVEQRHNVGLIAKAENGGVSVERAAEIIEESGELARYGFHGDTMDIRDIIIEVLSHGNPRSYINKRKEEQLEEARRESEADLEQYAEEKYHMTLEDAIAYEETVVPELIRHHRNFDEQEYYSRFADEIIEQQNREDYARSQQGVVSAGTSTGDGRGGEVLSPQGVNDGSGVSESDTRQSVGSVGNGLPSNSAEANVSEGTSGGGVIGEQVQAAEADVNVNPTDKQKEAGNYKKGHVQIGTFNVTIEQPKGSVRSGVDANGNKWETEMQNTYGYIRGTEGVDGDHIDVFLSDDIDSWNGRQVYVVDQRNEDGSFDEHKVMLGFNDIDDAEAAYLSNYEDGWQGLGAITGVAIEDFEKWIDSSHRKTKAFAEYKSVKTTEGQSAVSPAPSLLDVVRTLYSKGKEVASKLFSMKFFDVAQTPKFMQELGLRGDKFTIRYGVIARHFGKDSEHTLPQEIWEQLPEALLHPFAITKYYEDEKKQKQKGYRLYTSLQLSNGSYIVVSAEVKNAGRDIEVNAINTIFGRSSLSEVHDELIYTSETITPEQQSLLNGNNPHQYTANQELSSASKDITNSETTQVIDSIHSELGDLTQENAADYARRMYAAFGWETLEDANATLKEFLDRHQTPGRTLGVLPFLDEAQRLVRASSFKEEVLENGDKVITSYDSRGDVKTIALERDGRIVAVNNYDEGVLFERVEYDENGTATSVTRYGKDGKELVRTDKLEESPAPTLNDQVMGQGRSKGHGKKSKTTKTSFKDRHAARLAAKEEARRVPLRDRAKEWEEKLGVKVHLHEDISTVENSKARRAIEKANRRRGGRVSGWYDKKSGEVHFYLPHVESVEELDETYLHEVVGHHGLRELMGDRWDALCDDVWNGMSAESRERYELYEGVADIKDETLRHRAAADEYMAHLAERTDMNMTDEERSVWQKIVDAFRAWLEKVGITPGITDGDIQRLIRESYSRLEAKARTAETTSSSSSSAATADLVTALDEAGFGDSGLAAELRGMAEEDGEISFRIKKKAPETESAHQKDKHQPSVVSSADGAKVLNNLDNAISEYKNNENKRPNTFLGDIANALNARRYGSKSQYATFEAVNGNVVTIRLSDHNATISNFDNHGENNGISIVISPKENLGIFNDGHAHVVEYYYDAIALRRASGKPLVEILKSIKQALYSGEYNDTTGLAKRQEVNDSVSFRITTGDKDLDNRLGAALYFLNKEAKRYRDLKREFYNYDMTEDVFLALQSLGVLDAALIYDNGVLVRDEYDSKYFSTKEIDEELQYSEGEILAYENALEDDELTDEGREENEEYLEIEESHLKNLYDLKEILETYESLSRKDVFNVFSDAIEELYDKKERVLNALISEGSEDSVHEFPNGDVRKLYKLGDYSFHGKDISAEYDGEAEMLEEISSENKLKGAMDADEAMSVVDDFLAGVQKEGSENVMFSIRKPKRLTKKLVENNFGGIWIDDVREYAKFASAVDSGYGFEENGEGFTYTDNHFYFYYRNINGGLIPVASVYLNEYESQDAVKYLNNIINDTRRRGAGTNVLGLVDGFERKFLNKGLHSDADKPISPSSRNGDLGRGLLQKGSYLDKPSDYVKTRRNSDREGSDYQEDRVVGNSFNDSVSFRYTEEDDIRYKVLNDNQEIFVSNAARAVDGIKQDKATPQQWLAMIEKNAGLKAGEDKWLGLSDWLKASKAKTLTKQEVLDYINENRIQIAEAWYGEGLGDFSQQRLDEINDEFKELMTEGEEATGSVYTGDHADYAFNQMIERYGDGFELAFELGQNYELIPTTDYYDEMSDAAKDFLGAGNVINSTRLEYTTEGLENKREIALVVPTIEPWNASDEIHFGDAGGGRAVAWVRFGETKVYEIVEDVQEVSEFHEPFKDVNQHDIYRPVGSFKSGDFVVHGKARNGEMIYVVYINEKQIPVAHRTLEDARNAMNEYYKEHPRKLKKVRSVLVIDEIQSKRHQEGRERGYKPEYKKQLAQAEEEFKKSEEKYKNAALRHNTHNAAMLSKYGIGFNGASETEWHDLQEAYEDMQLAREIMMERREKLVRISNGERGSGVPDAPFDKNWYELAMKRMLRLAAEEDYDKVAWTSGTQQAERYNLADRIDEIKVTGGIDNIFTVIGIKDGYKSIEKDVEGEQGLSDMIGKDLARKAYSNLKEGKEDYLNEDGVVSFTGDNLSIGGEGMKGFYDKILPSFVQKYVKKWGAKVGTVELPDLEESAQTMWSVDVTDEMKRSVLDDGQVMFRFSNTPEEDDIRYSIRKRRFHNGKSYSRMWDALEMYTSWSNGVINLTNVLEQYYNGEIVEISAGGYHAIEDNGLVPVPGKKYSGEDEEYHHIRFVDNNGEEFVEAVPFVKAEDVEEKFGVMFRTIEERKGQLVKAESFIEESIKGKNKGKHFRIDLPKDVEERIENAIGRDFDTHNIYANGIIHAKNKHGVGGEKISSTSIPLRDEDFKLAPYIMVAPDYIEDGSKDILGRESIRFIKRLSNGTVVVVEKEQKNSPNDMDTITMWADLSSNGLDARNLRPLNTTSETVIAGIDVAKIRRDAELAIERDVIFEQATANNAKMSSEDNKSAAFRVRDDKSSSPVSQLLSDLESGGYKDSGLAAALREMEEDDVRFRRTSVGDASEEYERRTRGLSNNLAEAYVDGLRSLRVMQEAIARETGEKIKDWENVYLSSLNRSSVNKAESDKLIRELIDPLFSYVGNLIKGRRWRGHKMSYNDVDMYLNCVHGIERNRLMADRDRTRWQEKHDKWEKDVQEWESKKNAGIPASQLGAKPKEPKLKVRNDYSGLTALFDPNKSSNFTMDELKQLAQGYIDDFEQAVNAQGNMTGELWDKIRKINHWTMDKLRKSGMISKDQQADIEGMYQHYVPLRGWDEQTSDEVYNYMSGDKPAVGKVLRSADGRESRADNILATLANMANNAIVTGNKNKSKQALLSLAEDHPTRLLSISRAYYQEDATGGWTLVTPNLTPGMTPEQIEQELADFEERMDAARANGLVKTRQEALQLGMPITAHQAKEHAVHVWRGGKEYVVYVNGNPKAAQAANGSLNPEAKLDAVTKSIAKVMRFMARNVTAFSPEFIYRNAWRDAQAAAITSFAKYGAKYTARFSAELALNFKGTGHVVDLVAHRGKEKSVRQLYNALEDGTLDVRNERDRMFKEFIENGGETGYTQSLSVKDFKKRMDSLLRQKTRNAALSRMGMMTDGVLSMVERVNRDVENATRFAAYCASRKNGHTILHSISDAKEVSVNFNRKGSGAMGNIYVRSVYMFFNPAVQGLMQRVTLFKQHPGKMIATTAVGMTTLGIITTIANAMLCAILDGDDDDHNGYMGLSKWTQGTNFNIYIGDGSYVSVPLPPEERVFFRIGNAVARCMMGYDRMEDLPYEISDAAAMMMPIDVLDLRGLTDSDESFVNHLVRGFTPAPLVPVVETYFFNEDFAGNPITFRNQFNEHLPEWKRAGRDTWVPLVKLSKRVNEWTGGNDYKKGWIDGYATNPSFWQHQSESVLGGPLSFVAGVWNAVSKVVDPKEEVEVRDIPIARTMFKSSASDYSRNLLIRSEYDYYIDKAQGIDKQIKGYAKEGNKAALNEILTDNSKDWDVYTKYVELRPTLNAMKEARSDAYNTGDPQEIKDFNKKYYNTLKIIVDEFRLENDNEQVTDMLSRRKEFGDFSRRVGERVK